MPTRLVMPGLLFAACLLMTPTDASADAKFERLAAQNGWLSDYQQGLGEARKSGKPLFVVFRCQP